jgi:hypothetical protein
MPLLLMPVKNKTFDKISIYTSDLQYFKIIFIEQSVMLFI